MVNHIEVFQALNELNECEDCLMFPAEMRTDGFSFRIDWLGQCLWMSEEDEREFNEEKDEWEPLGQYLIREQNKRFADIENEIKQRGFNAGKPAKEKK